MLKEIMKVGLGGLDGGLKGATGQDTAQDIGQSIGKIFTKLGKKKEDEEPKDEKAMSDKNLKKGCSDENLKSLYPDATEEMLEYFANIEPIKFTYKQEAQALYQDEGKGVDSAEHIGVKAQDLEKNPITQGCVSEDEHGFKEVDTRHLAFADTAMISQLCKEVLILKNEIEMLKGALKNA